MSAIFFGGDPRLIVREAISKQLVVVATQQVIDEYREVAQRLHEQYPTVAYRRQLAVFESLLTVVRPASLRKSICRDPDDDAILACALGGKAKIICSGDADLLVMNGFRGIEILKPREFRLKYLDR